MTLKPTDTWVTKNCAECGGSFTRPAAWLKRRVAPVTGYCCSRHCAQKARRHARTMIAATCIKCGDDFQYKKGISGPHRYCSRACAWADRSRRFSRENHPNWHGGISTRTSETRKVIEAAKLEKRCCERCGSKENLHGHHREPHSTAPSLREDKSNIEVLCANCHAAEHPELANMIAMPKRKTGLTVRCKQCGQSYYVKRSHAATTKYCSRRCQGIARRLDRGTIFAMRREGVTLARIAARIGGSESRVSAILRDGCFERRQPTVCR